MGSGAAALPRPPTPLLGRETELARVDTVLAAEEFPLVTLTGPPGVGKTHLALVAAGRAADRFAEGAIFVDLTAAQHPGSLLGEIARAVRCGEAPGQALTDRLVEVLANRSVMLVLDNCEHLLPAPELTHLLVRCPQVRVLATSRERLNLSVEREFPVMPLPVPSPADSGDLARIAASPAVRLLVERAKAVQPGFVVTPENANDIADTCIRLDGLPLALELAAAQTKVFSPSEIAYRIRHRTTLLAGGSYDRPGRHQGLRTAISWSHNLLPEHERTVFRRFAVFVGGATLAAVDVVCSDDSDEGVDGTGTDLAPACVSLVNKSLLRTRRRPDGVTVFSMLESIREFAADELSVHAETPAVRARHARFYSDLARQAEKGVGTEDEDVWWDWLGYEHGNLHAALSSSLATADLSHGLWLAAALGWFCYTRGQVGEGRTVLDRALTAADGDSAPDVDALAGVLLIAGIIAWGQRELDEAERRLERALRLSETVGDARRVAIANAFLGHVARDRGHHDVAETRHRRARDLHEEGGNQRGTAWAQYDLGLLAWRRGEMGAAGALLTESLRRFQEIDYCWASARSASALAGVEVQRGNLDAARSLALIALDGFERVDDRRGLAQCLEQAAAIAAAARRAETAAQLLGAADELRRALAAPPSPGEQDARDWADRRARRLLGDERAERAHRAGRRLSIAAVTILAKEVVGAMSGREPPAAPPTRRECEVAALVAGGSTNREIGRALGISEKTVEVHLRNTMSKIGARSRAEIAAWAVARGLYEPPYLRTGFP